MDLKNEFTEFINEKNIVGVCAGVTIAYVSKDVVLSLVSDIVIPVFILIVLRLRLPLPKLMMPDKSLHSLNVTKFLASIITWVLAILITYFFIKFAFSQMLGISLTKQQEKEKEKEKEKDIESTKKTENSTNDAVQAASIDGIDAFTMFSR